MAGPLAVDALTRVLEATSILAAVGEFAALPQTLHGRWWLGVGFARAFAVDALLALAHGVGAARRLVDGVEWALEVKFDNFLYEYCSPLYDEDPAPVLAYSREAAGRALLGRAAAILAFHCVVGLRSRVTCDCCNDGSIEASMNERLHDGLVGRAWSVNVDAVRIAKVEDDEYEEHEGAFLPRDVAACETLHAFARGLLPRGFVAPVLPAPLLALKAAPENDAAWLSAGQDRTVHGEPLNDGFDGYQRRGQTTKWQPDLLVRQKAFLDAGNRWSHMDDEASRVLPQIDLCAHLYGLTDDEAVLRSLNYASDDDADDYEDKLVVGMRAIRVAPLCIGAYRAAELTAPHDERERDVRLPDGFVFTAAGDEAPGAWRGVTAVDLEALAAREAAGAIAALRAAESRLHGAADARVENALDAATARNVALRARTALLRSDRSHRGSGGPVVLELARFRALVNCGRGTTVSPAGSEGLATRPELPDDAFRRLCAYLPEGPYCQVVSCHVKFGFCDPHHVFPCAAAHDDDSDDEGAWRQPRGPPGPFDGSLAAPRITITICVHADSGSYEASGPLLEISGWLDGFEAPEYSRSTRFDNNDDNHVEEAAAEILSDPTFARFRDAANPRLVRVARRDDY
ncbi:hypothetical protein M885DRAFT_620255 [Pelagophyceae sp. CCMP2097]|nr:hypothetical protein M885DRAFT_620255 [Pelagophyceae sp. CCMP2097]